MSVDTKKKTGSNVEDAGNTMMKHLFSLVNRTIILTKYNDFFEIIYYNKENNKQ